MDRITKEQALEAYNTIKEYCAAQSYCPDCLFAGEDLNGDGICILADDSCNPERWQELELP